MGRTALFLVALAVIGCAGPQTVPPGLNTFTVAKPSTSSAPSHAVHANATFAHAVLYDFAKTNGAYPQGMISGKKGTYLGVATNGGVDDNGVVYELVPSGSKYREVVLYKFQGGNDGANPYGKLLADASGAYYGTTATGGGAGACRQGCGTVFKIAPSGTGYTESVIYRFRGGKDGAGPMVGLSTAPGTTGPMFGTTYAGGHPKSCRSPACGTIFELTPSGAGYTEKVLWRFSNKDGGAPWSPVLVRTQGTAIKLFGTASGGGAFASGTVYEYTSAGLRVLHTFDGFQLSPTHDGAFPIGGLDMDASGKIYGTTYEGGFCRPHLCPNRGIVYRLVPSGSQYSEQILYRFAGNRDGANPAAGVVLRDGLLYGTTRFGGGGKCRFGNAIGCGTVYKLTPTGGNKYVEAILYRFSRGVDGKYPETELQVESTTNSFLGLTPQGGINGAGTMYRLSNPSS